MKNASFRFKKILILLLVVVLIRMQRLRSGRTNEKYINNAINQ
jgi:hypothetical protein